MLEFDDIENSQFLSNSTLNLNSDHDIKNNATYFFGMENFITEKYKISEVGVSFDELCKKLKVIPGQTTTNFIYHYKCLALTCLPLVFPYLC